MNKYRCSLSETKFTAKPTKLEIKRITYTEQKLSLSELGSAIKSGRCWCPSTFIVKKVNPLSRTNDNFKDRTIFGFDFDSGISLNEVLKIAESAGLKVNAWYKTFSWTPELEKFRILIVSDKTIEVAESSIMITKNIMKLFSGKIDSSCSDNARFFNGSAGHFELLSDEENDLERFNIPVEPIEMSKTKKEPNLKPTKGAVLLEKKSQVINFNFDKCYQRVTIWRDFIDGRWLYHNELFGLATNMCNIERGIEIMIDTMYKHNLSGATKYSTEKFVMVKHVLKKGYQPQTLDKFSYDESDKKLVNCIVACQDKNKLVRDFNPKHSTPDLTKRVTIEQARIDLRRVFEEVMNSSENICHVIQAPVGIGKTELVTSVENVIIAVPNHRLKEELSRRMKVPFRMTQEVPKFSSNALNEDIQSLYDEEKTGEVTKLLKNIAGYYNSGYSLKTHDYALAQEFFKKNNECLNTKETILTTHAKVMSGFFSNESKSIIFDEDLAGVGSKTRTMNLSTINKLMNTEDLVSEIEKNGNGYYVLSNHNPENFNHWKVKELVRVKRYNKDEDFIHFITDFNISTENKFIVLTATPDLTWYRHKIPNFKLHKIDEVITKGKIVQDMSMTYSKKSLANLRIDQKKLPVEGIITFLDKVDEVEEGTPTCYFFNSLGTNNLEGKNLGIVGTPSNPSKAFLLKAHSMGVDFTPDETHFSYREVTWKNHTFNFTSFKSDELREIHFSQIENELIQSTGRSRITNFDVNVFCYCGFPIPGSEFKKLPELIEIENSEENQ